jgi:cysteate synthase
MNGDDVKMLNDEKLLCLDNLDELADDGLILENPNAGRPALLRTVYNEKALEVKENLPGIFKFSGWLPAARILKSDGAPVTYRSLGLSERLKLQKLYVTFNGYWPEKGAMMKTGTFKECEAYSVCARFPQDAGILVVASAGNTARAFMKVASDNNIRIVLVVPEKNLGSLWSIEKLNPCVRIVAVGGDADYTDAINLAGALCRLDGFINEGGAKNVARRDGMGTTVLSAVTEIGEIPDYYFQAVGSGTGAIAAHEANLRFNQSGSYGKKMMRLFVSQNLPFTPMADAWKKRSRTLDPIDPDEAVRQIDQIAAKVLSNRQPPYGVIGGLYDALCASDGDVIAVDNRQIGEAQALFAELEGRDICPEAGAALASLIMKVKDGTVDRGATVMLNVTGGGFDALAKEYRPQQARAGLVIDKSAITSDGALQKIRALF